MYDGEANTELHIEPFMLGEHMQVMPTGMPAVSYYVMVDTGRGSDETVTYVVDVDTLRRLLAWVQGNTHSHKMQYSPEELLGMFAAKLDAALKGYGNGARLCRFLNVSSMRLYHWRQGNSLPSTEYLLRICRYFKWPVAETLYMVNTERAARSYYRYVTVDKVTGDSQDAQR